MDQKILSCEEPVRKNEPSMYIASVLVGGFQPVVILKKCLN